MASQERMDGQTSAQAEDNRAPPTFIGRALFNFESYTAVRLGTVLNARHGGLHVL